MNNRVNRFGLESQFPLLRIRSRRFVCPVTRDPAPSGGNRVSATRIARDPARKQAVHGYFLSYPTLGFASNFLITFIDSTYKR
jgi:hypothetical protein